MSLPPPRSRSIAEERGRGEGEEKEESKGKKAWWIFWTKTRWDPCDSKGWGDEGIRKGTGDDDDFVLPFVVLRRIRKHGEVVLVQVRGRGRGRARCVGVKGGGMVKELSPLGPEKYDELMIPSTKAKMTFYSYIYSMTLFSFHVSLLCNTNDDGPFSKNKIEKKRQTKLEHLSPPSSTRPPSRPLLKSTYTCLPFQLLDWKMVQWTEFQGWEFKEQRKGRSLTSIHTEDGKGTEEEEGNNG